MVNFEGWLYKKLASGESNVILSDWCAHWARRVNTSVHLLNQTIVRELFWESLYKLQSLSCISAAAAKAYMLIDVADGVREHPGTKAYQAAVNIPRYSNRYLSLSRFTEATEQLTKHVDNCSTEEASGTCVRLAEIQTCSFNSVASGPYYGQSSNMMIILDTIRMYLALQGVQNPKLGPAVMHWQANKDKLLASETAACLYLSGWQLRTLILCGAQCEDVLTKSQADYFWKWHCPE